MTIFQPFMILLTGLMISVTSLQVRADALLCSHLPHIQRGFLNHHISFKSYNPALENRVIQQYIEKLDPSKIYLLQEDVTKITEMMKDIYGKTQKEKCNPLVEAHDLFVQRVKERTKFTEAYLKAKYKLSKDTELVLDPKKRQFLKTKSEADEFHIKYIHFQVANNL
ncbi:MAG: tail-specific protease, partial [Bdellovibrionales bacterium]